MRDDHSCWIEHAQSNRHERETLVGAEALSPFSLLIAGSHLGDDCTSHIQHTWHRGDGISESKVSSTTMSADQFVETTRDVEVLGSSLCAVLSERERQAEGVSDIVARATKRLH